MNPAVRLVRRTTSDDTRFRLHSELCRRRWSAELYALLQPKIRGCLVGADTDLVIEGFPRSANTYAVAAFRCANGTGPVVASHLHAAASVLEAVRRGVPSVLLLREPLDACASLMQRQDVRPATALTAYVRLHRALEPVLDRVVVSDFATTTTDFGAVLRAVNDRFGTGFTPYVPTPENEEWCRAWVTEADRRDQGEVRESTLALPQESRAAGRELVVSVLRREHGLLAEAQARYAAARARAIG